jgi:hypothetical protein
MATQEAYVSQTVRKGTWPFPHPDEFESLPIHHSKGAQSAEASMLSDLHALIVKLEARIMLQEERVVEQENRTAALQRENSNLLRAIHRVSKS